MSTTMTSNTNINFRHLDYLGKKKTLLPIKYLKNYMQKTDQLHHIAVSIQPPQTISLEHTHIKVK
jgi:hypothetical protein